MKFISPWIPTLPSRTPRSLSEVTEPTIPNEPEGSEPTDPTEPTILGQGVENGVTWTVYSNGVMYIEGPGSIPSYVVANLPSITPWYQYQNMITNIKITDVNSIGKYAFSSCSALEMVSLPATLHTISMGAFMSCNNLREVYFDGTTNQWNAISIASLNDDLLNATIICNDDYVEPEIPDTTEPADPTEPTNPSQPSTLYGPVSNARFEMVDGSLRLVFDYPEGVSGPIDGVTYQVVVNSFALNGLSTNTNVLDLSTLDLAGMTIESNQISVKTQVSGYGVAATAACSGLSVQITKQTKTTQPVTVEFEGKIVKISGLTPNAPFKIIFNHSDSSGGKVIRGKADKNGYAEGTITFDLNFTNLSYTVVETETQVSADGMAGTINYIYLAENKQYVLGSEDDAMVAIGDINGTITWTLYNNGLLDFQGRGSIPSYLDALNIIDQETPWESFISMITSVNIGEGIYSIGNSAFEGHYRLKTVTIGNGLTAIGMYAFDDCSQLTSIALPASVTSIGSYAFNHCGALTDVYYAGSYEMWKEITIHSMGSSYLTDATIHYAE